MKILSLYSVLFFVAISQCRVFLVDDDCIKHCTDDLPVSNWKAKTICIDICKQPERPHHIVEDTNNEPRITSSVGIISFIREVLNSLIMLSKGFGPIEDKLNEKVLAFLESDNKISNNYDNTLINFRRKRDAQFTANLRGRARADTQSDFSLDRGGLTGNLNSQLNYEGVGKGTGRLSAGPIELNGDFNGDIAGTGQLGIGGNLGGPGLLSLNGNWKHSGEGNLAGRGTANVYGLTIGGAGGKLNAQYGGDGTFEGGIGRGGLVGIDYNARNAAKFYGKGGIGVGHPAIGLGAGVVAEGGGTAESNAQGGIGLTYGKNGFGIGGKTNTQTNLAGGVDLSGGIGDYDKYANEAYWKSR